MDKLYNIIKSKYSDVSVSEKFFKIKFRAVGKSNDLKIEIDAEENNEETKEESKEETKEAESTLSTRT